MPQTSIRRPHTRSLPVAATPKGHQDDGPSPEGIKLLGKATLGILALTVTLLVLTVLVVGGLILLMNLLFTLGMATSGIGE